MNIENYQISIYLKDNKEFLRVLNIVDNTIIAYKHEEVTSNDYGYELYLYSFKEEKYNHFKSKNYKITSSNTVEVEFENLSIENYFVDTSLKDSKDSKKSHDTVFNSLRRKDLVYGISISNNYDYDEIINNGIENFINNHFGHIVNEKIDWLYIGNSFCDKLLPSERKLKKILEISSKYKVCLVLPIMVERNMENFRKLIQCFENYEKSNKCRSITVNDIGTILLINDDKVKINLGQLLVKQKKDREDLDINVLNDIQQKNKYFARISRTEFDYGLNKIKSNVKSTLYYPFYYTNVSLKCPTVKIKKENKNQIFIESCNNICCSQFAKDYADYKSSDNYLSGVAIVKKHCETNILQKILSNNSQVDRVIFNKLV